MESDAYIVAKRIPAGTISQIRRAEDFDGDEYQTLCEVMNGTFLMNLDMNRQLYCTIQRLDDNMEQGFAVAYLNQSNGVYYPMDEVETEEVRTVYRTNAAVWDEEISNVSGTYVSVKVPVLEKGEVCGVVSVGSETSVIESMITRLQIQIIMSIVVILLLIWLITSEIMAWFTNKALYKNSVAEGDKEALPGHLIRLLVFAVFACYNMSATFLPVWILRNSGVFPESSREFMSSLPITVNIFVIGTMSLFTAGAVRRLGIKTILLVSTACSLIGNLLMFLFPSYYSIFGGLIISGIGVGLITNALNVMLTYIRNEENRQWGFTVYNAAQLSGVNFGMLLGSLLAVAVGQRPVFLVVAIAWLLLMLTGNLLVRQLSNLLASDSQEGDAQKEGISTARFLFNKPVLSFIVLMQNPYIVFNSFVMFYVPLFCGNNGFDETIVSILILVYSEVAIMTGDMLTQRMTKLLGNFGMYAAFATNILAVLVFALTRNMLGIVLALLMMGTAAAYGKTMQQTWFLKQTPVQRYGEDRAMGVYNFTENIGESLGPIVFGSLMAQNPLMAAVAPFCAAMATLGSGHLALNFKELRKK
jgi:predicted MFS family arabinose efflux permease